MPSRLYLWGMPGAGKTTIGKALANRWDWEFVDLDAEIERLHGLSIPDIFDRWGEQQFRQWESETLHHIIESEEIPRIIACGGGTPLIEASRIRMISTGYTVFLDVDIDLLYNRLRQWSLESRPLLKELREKELHVFLHELYRRRIGAYRQAHVRIVIDRAMSVSDICHIIEKKLEGFASGDLTLRPSWKSD